VCGAAATRGQHSNSHQYGTAYFKTTGWLENRVFLARVNYRRADAYKRTREGK
jgi:hypothetical protein